MSLKYEPSSEPIQVGVRAKLAEEYRKTMEAPASDSSVAHQNPGPLFPFSLLLSSLELSDTHSL